MTLHDVIADDVQRVFLDRNAGFAEAATWTGAGGATEVSAIRDETPETAAMFAEVAVEGIAVVVGTSDVPGIKKLDQFSVGGNSYYVAETRDDGTGMTRLFLTTHRHV